MSPDWVAAFLTAALVAFVLAAVIVALATDQLRKAPLFWVALGLALFVFPAVWNALVAA